uniref:Glycosyl transferase family 25 domain-containing protein n=1 Tax=Alexandrium monilatum TaxID=311494 RepID=A0A7S4RTH9_9DINO
MASDQYTAVRQVDQQSVAKLHVMGWRRKAFCHTSLAGLLLLVLAGGGGARAALERLLPAGPEGPRSASEGLHGRLRQLTPLCNASVFAPQQVSSPFNLPEPWASACHGKGPHPVPPPPSAAHWPGQQNWCWNWVKHKGCKEVIAKLNWQDAQKRTAGFHMAPPVTVAPMQPMQNPAMCEQYGLGATLMASPAEMQAAKTWLQANVAVYVLNLPRDRERRQFMASRLAELGIQPHFVPGVDLTVPGTYARMKQEGIIPRGFDAQKAQQTLNGVGGMIGCASAHLSNMRRIATSGQAQPMAVVLEDDVRLEDDFALKLQRLVTTEAPCDWQVISLKSACPFGVCMTPHLTRVQPDPNEPEGRCRHGVNYGFYGMLYRVESLESLRLTLSHRVFDASAPHCLDVDVALASISDQVPYYAVPYWQQPGLLQMGGHGSSRNVIDKAKVDLSEPAGNTAPAGTAANGAAPAVPPPPAQPAPAGTVGAGAYGGAPAAQPPPPQQAAAGTAGASGYGAAAAAQPPAPPPQPAGAGAAGASGYGTAAAVQPPAPPPQPAGAGAAGGYAAAPAPPAVQPPPAQTAAAGAAGTSYVDPGASAATSYVDPAVPTASYG